MASTLRLDDEDEALELIREVGRGKADVTEVAKCPQACASQV